MSKTSIKPWLTFISDIYGDLLTMDGYDDCILGLCTRQGSDPFIVYDRAKVIKRLMQDGMTEDEASDFHQFNQADAFRGPHTPAFLIRP